MSTCNAVTCICNANKMQNANMQLHAVRPKRYRYADIQSTLTVLIAHTGYVFCGTLVRFGNYKVLAAAMHVHHHLIAEL